MQTLYSLLFTTVSSSLSSQLELQVCGAYGASGARDGLQDAPARAKVIPRRDLHHCVLQRAHDAQASQDHSDEAEVRDTIHLGRRQEKDLDEETERKDEKRGDLDLAVLQGPPRRQALRPRHGRCFYR